MKKGVFAFVGLIALLLVVFYLKSRNYDNEPGRALNLNSTVSNSALAAVSSGGREPMGTKPKQEGAMQSVPTGSIGTNKWEWLREMTMKDRYIAYKAPISFYGRIVDEVENTVSGVKVDFSLVDASEATGVSTLTAISDNNGRFSIEGARGKSLLVTRLTKPGYTQSVSRNTFSFNYGWFPDPSYHSADPMNPVTFVMRKNGPKEALLEVSRRLPVSTNQPTVLNLGGDDSTSVRIDVLQNQAEKKGQAGTWLIRISVPSGGIQVSTNEFPFEAPETGYEPSILVHRHTPKPETWAYPYVGGEFFVRTGSGYGRMHLQMLEGSPHLSIISYYNPNNSRNLEP